MYWEIKRCLSTMYYRFVSLCMCNHQGNPTLTFLESKELNITIIFLWSVICQECDSERTNKPQIQIN